MSDAAPAPPPDAAPPPLAADGQSCKTAADCQSGTCEGEGCDDEGVCAPRQRGCTKDLRAYCGCDGVTFRASGSCPGRRFVHRGECKAAGMWRNGQAPDFAPCLRADQCQSGVCEGEGCDDQHPGTCRPAMEGCGQMAVQYCGCDGRSFSSSPCPRRRYRSRGAWCPGVPPARPPDR